MLYYLTQDVYYFGIGLIGLLTILLVVIVYFCRQYIRMRLLQQFFGREGSIEYDVDGSHTFNNPKVLLDALVTKDRIHRITPNSLSRGESNVFIVHKWLGVTVTPKFITAVNNLIRRGKTNYAHALLDWQFKNLTKEYALVEDAIKAGDTKAIETAIDNYNKATTIKLLDDETKMDAYTQSVAEIYKFYGDKSSAYGTKHISEEEKLTVEKKQNQSFIEKWLFPIGIFLILVAFALILLNSAGLLHTNTATIETATTTATTLAQNITK